MNAAANKLPAMADRLGLEIGRLRRLTGGGGLDALAERSLALNFMLAMETGKGFEDGPRHAYSQLAKGNLREALHEAQNDHPLYERVLRLVAASDGADPQWVREALALAPDAGQDVQTAWMMLALADREGLDGAPYRKWLSNVNPRERDEAHAVLAFADALSHGARPEQADALLVHVSVEWRGAAHGYGVIRFGKLAPAAWRTEAKALLFSNERPYFG
jgi:hypothetical protein